MLKTNITNNIAKQQISNQILFNRAVVQIGLSAFRLGHFDECNSSLCDVAQNPKLRESLAQGQSNYSRLQEKTLEEELEEKKRYVPPHLQVNLELLDCVFMVTSMMLEIVNISENKFIIHKKVISRNYRKLIEQYDQKGIQFVSQSYRDFIVEASRNLHHNKWQAAYKSLSSIKLINKLSEFQNGSLKQALQQKLKETSLKIYLIESQNTYASFSLPNIETQFEISKSDTLKQVSKLILNGSITAQIDHSTHSLIVENRNSVINVSERKEMEHLQYDNLDKIKQMVEANERCMELLVN